MIISENSRVKYIGSNYSELWGVIGIVKEIIQDKDCDMAIVRYPDGRDYTLALSNLEQK